MGNNKFPPFLRICSSTIGQFCPHRGTIPQKGGDIFVAHQFLCVLDIKFNVDYDFSIKHDLISWSDQLMDIHSLHQKKGAQFLKKGGKFFVSHQIFYVY